MEKRLFLAIALSLLVLLAWSALFPKSQPIVNKAVKQESPHFISSPPPFSPSSYQKPSPNTLKKLKISNREVVFSTDQACINTITFLSYQSYSFSLKEGLLLEGLEPLFQEEDSSDPQEVTFAYRDQDKSIIKRFKFLNSNYDLWLYIEVRNLIGSPLKFSPALILGALNFSDHDRSRFLDVAWENEQQVTHTSGRKEMSIDNAKWAAFRDRYFCSIVQPNQIDNSVFIRRTSASESRVGIKTKEIVLLPGEKIEIKFHIYLGPQDLKSISRINPQWVPVVYYGKLDLIAQVLWQTLEFLYRLVKNWGLAIVFLSLLIYFLLYPFTLKQMRSMKEMQALQPRIEELRKVYKDNPQKLNKEIMELYRAHKVNPFGGCLPLILQLPIFFALYQVLMRAVALKGAPFLWIKDLSEPDRLMIFKNLPSTFPIMGNEFNLLPILMSMIMFLQQKSTLATSPSSGSQEQQKIMMVIFPLLFGIMFYRMPSGLVLYWLINSSLTFFYQWHIRPKHGA
ncbi:MAG: membrane protein insertase YidC [Candidatus Omnitrophica bacterium]|nr:membrane protein insertase YidC [Candidatus Omnitrophota bacterium]